MLTTSGKGVHFSFPSLKTTCQNTYQKGVKEEPTVFPSLKTTFQNTCQ